MHNTFESLETTLTTEPVLVIPNYEKPFIVETDASNTAVVSVLSQLDDYGREHPIHYASRSLISSETNYSAFEREALGIVYALKRFRHNLLCQKVKCYTEHEAF